MNETARPPETDAARLTTDLVSAYVANNRMPIAELPALIASVHATLNGLASCAPDAVPQAVERPTPSQIRKSIKPDALISFVDGRAYKTLKRHLATHGLDPDAYRQRYGLPSDYPMVAASYAAQRSELAKSIGLGRRGGVQVKAARTKSRGRDRETG